MAQPGPDPAQLRVGFDLVDVDDVRAAIATHGERYLDRVYTERERADALDAPERLAARFAAKEATIKVLRPRDDYVAWRCVEVRRHASGWVELALTGHANDLARNAQITTLELSLTHERGCAGAVVIATTTGRRGATTT